MESSGNYAHRISHIDHVGVTMSIDVSSLNCASYKRLVIEFCCSQNSKLGSPAMIDDPECLVVRSTQDIDMTTPRVLKFALNALREFDGPVALWASIPCTGGSPWQYDM